MGKAIVEVISVSLLPVNDNLLWGRHIDKPKAGDFSNTYSLQISGWVLGKSPVVALNIISEGRLLQQTTANKNRPDVGRAFPKVSGGESCGFNTQLGVIGLPAEDVITLQAMLENGKGVAIGKIRFSHQPLRSNYQPKLQPLLVSSTGRSGTTWLMRLLSNHPQIVTSQNYPYESRAALYWMQMLKALSLPGSDGVSNPEKGFEDEMQWLGRNALYNSNISPPNVLDWVGRGYPELFAAFCQQSIDGFYEQMAESYGKQFPDFQDGSGNGVGLMYFAEKNPLSMTPLLELYPQGKEILLVRDFRDVICSILAFNAKRGYDDFGRQNFDNDADYVRSLSRAINNTLPKWRKRNPECTYLVRYEDLILSPIEIIDGLLNFVGLEHQSSLLENMLQQSLEDTDKLKKHRTSSDPKASIGRWQQDLEPSIQAVCNEVFAEVLQEFGYS